jgi:molybdopterin converting factor small subunit
MFRPGRDRAEMKILFYGRLAEAIGSELELETPSDASVAEVRGRLCVLYPQVSATLQSRRTRACIGNRLVGDEHRPLAADTLEFLPPVSGG